MQDEIISDRYKLNRKFVMSIFFSNQAFHLFIYLMRYCPFEKTERYKNGINFYLHAYCLPLYVTPLINGWYKLLSCYFLSHLPWDEERDVVFCCNAVVLRSIFLNVVLTLYVVVCKAIVVGRLTETKIFRNWFF